LGETVPDCHHTTRQEDDVSNDLGDHTQWNSSSFSGAAIGLSAALGAAMVATLMRAAERRQQPQRIFSARELREEAEAIHALEIYLMQMRLKHSQDAARRFEKQAAEAVADLKKEQLRNLKT
jgi:hypothetical protein